MARWGERDARWVVQEREDGSNVRGWHWEEKNAMSWTKERLAELLTDLSTTAGPAAVKVTQVKSITGEALLTVRKNNRAFGLFELAITLAWQGTWEGGEPVNGELTIVEFSSLCDDEDIEVTVSVSGSGSGSDELRGAVAALRPELLARLRQYTKEINLLAQPKDAAK